jgi:hypothetical protein
LALNIIDFSNGIRPEEIQDNFEYLQDQISRERASVGGSGIASGLEITVNVNPDKFQIILSNGTLIDDNGEEIFINGKTIDIDPPILYQYKETLSLSKDKTVTLKHVPYALDRRYPVEYAGNLEPELCGITIKHQNSLYADDYIRVRNVSDRVLTVAGALLNELDVTYSYTAKRIDTLYLNEDLEIKIKQGTTSTTPSVALPTDAKYLIAYLEIDNEYITEDDTTPHAYIYVKDDLRTIRNLYTTQDGTLYICGVPFDDLQIIHLKEPKNPQNNTLWLNLADNTLYCWRSTNEFVYKNKIDITTDFVEEENAEYIFSTYMDFRIGENELSVYLNDSLLRLGIDYEEMYDELPTYGGNEGDAKRGNIFRILQTIQRPDGYKDILIDGDVLTYIIRYKDSQYMWVPVNKMNYTAVKHTRTYTTYYDGISDDYIWEKDDTSVKAYFDSSLANSLGVDPGTEYPNKYQYFIFDREKDLDMHFTPYRKELSVMINQMYLHEDQFKELTVYDLYENKVPKEIVQAAAEHFGWTTGYLQDKFNAEFDRSGIGFMLMQPLDSGANADGIGSDYNSIYGSNDLFVEAIVEHRVCSTPIDRKLQRSATFIYEDSFVADINFDPIVKLDGVSYRYDEHQLEVFVNGSKQVLGTDYIEEFGYFKQLNVNLDTGLPGEKIVPPINETYEDQDYFIRKKSAVCTMFKFLHDLDVNSIVSYKITTNVYSYDHINNILDGIGDIVQSCKTITESATSRMKAVEDLVSGVNARLKALEEEKEVEDPRYLTTDSILSLSQMPHEIVSGTVKSLKHINTSITLKEGQYMYSMENIWVEDYINIFHHSNVNHYDQYWVAGLHYNLREVSSGGMNVCYLELTDKAQFTGGDVIYISGIKLSNNREIGGESIG